MPTEIDLPDVVAEVSTAFAAYEKALTSNDVAALDALFHKDARTIRYGIGENLYGYDAIAAFRAARSPAGLMRELAKTVIAVLGSKPESISIGIEDVGPDDWDEKVRKPDIVAKPDTIFKSMG